MNDLINATLEFFIDAIMIVLGFTGVPSDILDGMFDDIVLAFQLVENFDRRVNLGPYGPPEMFFPTGSAAFTLDTFFAQIKAMWDTRGYVSAKVSFDDGYPYRLGMDIFSGAQALLERRGVLYGEYIEDIRINIDRQTGRSVKAQIGDGQAEEAPITRIQRKLVSAEELINIVTMSSN